MTNEELLEKIDQRFLIEREETRKMIQVEARNIVQQETRKIVKEEVKLIFNEEGRKIVQEETRAIFNEQGRNIVKEEVKKETEPIKKYLIRLDKRSLKTNKTLHLIAKLYNQEDVKLKKRVTNIEEYLAIPTQTLM